MSKIIRTVRLSGPVVTLGQAERELYARVEHAAEAPRLDLPRLIAERVQALREELEQQAQQRLQEALQAAEKAAAQQLETVRAQAAESEARVAEERFQAGYQQGLDERESEAREAVERMAALHASMEEERVEVLSASESLIIDVAMAVARRILRAEVELDTTLVARVIHAVLEQLGQQSNLEIHVHPQDLRVARRFSRRWTERVEQDAVIKVRASEQVAPGGCMIEGEEENIDARLERQLDVLQEALRRRVEHRRDDRCAPPAGSATTDGDQITGESGDDAE